MPGGNSRLTTSWLRSSAGMNSHAEARAHAQAGRRRARVGRADGEPPVAQHPVERARVGPVVGLEGGAAAAASQRRSRRTSPGTRGRASRAESIGSSVKATKSEMSTATVMVRPNCRKNWPVMPFMKATGTKTATSVKVVAMTASAISRVPSLAARAGGSRRPRAGG